MHFSKYYKQFLILPAAFSLLALIALLLWGLKPSIDLVGGSLLQVSFPNGRPQVSQVEQIVAAIQSGETHIQPAGASDYQISMPAITDAQKNQIETALGGLGKVTETQFNSISPTIGSDLLHKGYVALLLVVLCIIAFIAFAFRKVSEPVASWKYGVIAIITLVHDMLIPTGLFALLGFVAGAEVDSLFIVGLLTILGISINDTIVVFDRIRENLALNQQTHKREPFEDTIERSIRQTLARSINTSLTVVVVLAALFILGPASTKNFALTLLVGMIAGTYSSIFLACPLLVLWQRWSSARAVVAKKK
ncbi:MAG: protein translocase subunit SecF [Minisyncoccia bacterium]